MNYLWIWAKELIISKHSGNICNRLKARGQVNTRGHFLTLDILTNQSSCTLFSCISPSLTFCLSLFICPHLFLFLFLLFFSLFLHFLCHFLFSFPFLHSFHHALYNIKFKSICWIMFYSPTLLKIGTNENFYTSQELSSFSLIFALSQQALY